ncbi:MAG: hypothetical protein KC505_09750 [Myxococcales bacterium]|nr:hypothetical protein [Myxococcales bacterium]USN51026.1 MAG: hypothetical protein H6731_01030 [Myxococcales bacterium]
MTTSLPTSGIYFDLSPIFADLNQRYFNEKISAHLRWGIKRTHNGARKKSIRLGSYHPGKKLITINPCLDQACVPLICVERILFHEMVHQRFPARRSSTGKVLVHYREFNEFEKNYPHLCLADHWIKTNLNRLLKF